MKVCSRFFDKNVATNELLFSFNCVNARRHTGTHNSGNRYIITSRAGAAYKKIISYSIFDCLFLIKKETAFFNQKFIII